MGSKWTLGPAILCIFAACASSNVVREYPRRQTNRPYTLPDHLNTWRLVSVFAHGESAGQSAHQVIVFPFLWESAISSSFTLEWSPLPTAFRYTIYDKTNSWLGTAFSLLGSPLYQFQDFNFTPIAQVAYRKVMTPMLALNSNLSIQLELRRSDEPLHAIVSNKFGILFQVMEEIALEPYLKLNLEIGTPRSGYFMSSESVDTSNLRIPIGLRASWFTFEQWEFALDYLFLRLNYPSDYRSHQVFLSTQYFF